MSVNDIEIKDILIGDVWLCSGQSNMELPVSRVTDMFAEEIYEAKIVAKYNGLYQFELFADLMIP